MTARPAARSMPDRCPGVLRPHAAADGALVRLRVPGGVLTATALAQLSAAATSFGDGQVQLTSRGNLQIRGLTLTTTGEPPAGLVGTLSDAGLLPSLSHELVRNIVCSPLTGRLGGLADLRPLTAELDQLICRTPHLAELPGRFLFGLDDGRGDIAALVTDLGVRAIAPDKVVLTIGDQVGPKVDVARAAAGLVALADRFLRVRSLRDESAWHVRELTDGAQSMLRKTAVAPAREASESRPGVGVLRQADGRSSCSVAVPLGLLTDAQVDAIVAVAGLGSGEVVITPWRGVVIPDLTSSPDDALASLAAAGLVVGDASGWQRVSACTGAPGCAKAAGPTRPIAAVLAAAATADDVPLHVVACARRCGAPASEHVEVLLDGPIFRVSRRVTWSEDGCVAERFAELSALTSTVALAGNGR